MNNNLDDKIKAVLESEWGDKALGLSRDPGVFRQMIELTRGRMAWLNLLTWAISLVFLGGFIFAIFRFFDATTTKAMIGFAGLALWCAVTMSMLKIWFWLQMNLNSTLRELKRMELMVAMLVAGHEQD